MKRFSLTIVLLLLFGGATFAQGEGQVLRYERKQERKLKQEQWKYVWKTQRPRHEVQLGIGAFYRSMYSEPYFSHNSYDNFYSRTINWFGQDVYTKSEIFTPIISATYHYRLLKWLSLGGHISYAGLFAERENIITEESVFFQYHFLSIAPSVRFSFFNRNYISLYAGLSASLTYQFSKDEENGNFGAESYWEGQITGFGISAGNKWFGYAEFGYGNKGIVSAGFGYRFNSKNIER